MKKILSLVLFNAVLIAPTIASPAIQAEAGASYFVLRDTRSDSSTNVLSVDEPTKVAPFVAATYDFTERVGLRLSYHFLNNVQTTAQHGSPPGSPIQVIVWGHYRDDIHLFTAAPEFKFPLSPKLSLALSPQLNWVASRGVVSFSTTDPTVLLVGPRERDEEGITWGGSVRALWAIDSRFSISVGYQYSDLDPSFDRQAHIFSGGLLWKF